MLKLEIAADPGVQKGAVAATAAASGVGAWLAHATEIAVGLFGVPLPVVLAAAMAAYGVRSIMHSTSYPQAVFVGGMWAGIGVFGAQLALWVLGAKLGVAVAPEALPGLAMTIAGAGQYFSPTLAGLAMDYLKGKRKNIGGQNDN